MQGNEVFKVAVKTLTNDVVDILEQNNIKPSQVDHFIPHQANFRIIEAVRTKLDFPVEKTVLTIEKYGNTSAAAVAIAFDEARRTGRFGKGDNVVLVTFGAGLTWGAAAIRW